MQLEIAQLEEVLEKAAAGHNKICPRIVLGARIGLAAADILGMNLPIKSKKMLVFVETDGCFVSGIESATGCAVQHRTLRVLDYGKVAATFVNVKTGKAVRIAPRKGIRSRAKEYAPEEPRSYFAMLVGYQRMPLDELLIFEEVVLSTPIKTIISRPGVRVNCDQCEEEIINEREVLRNGQTLCQPCANPTYFQRIDAKPIEADLGLLDGSNLAVEDRLKMKKFD